MCLLLLGKDGRMTRVRKTHGEGFKFKVALAALKGDRTLGELSREYAISVGAIQKWREQLEGGGKSLFADKRRRSGTADERTVAKLHEKVGELTMERDFLKKALES